MVDKNRYIYREGRGRPPKVSTDKKKDFIAALADTGNVTKAAERVGVPRKTLYDHKARDEEFAEAWNYAMNEAHDRLEYEAWRRAVHGVDRPVYQKGELIGFEKQYSDNVLIRLLEATKPEKYRHRSEAKVVDDPLQNILDQIDGESASPGGEEGGNGE